MPSRRFQRVDFAQQNNDDPVLKHRDHQETKQNQRSPTTSKHQKLEVPSSGLKVGIDTGCGLEKQRSAPEPSPFLDNTDTREIGLPRPNTAFRTFSRSVISTGGNFKNLITRRRDSPSLSSEPKMKQVPRVPRVPLEHERALVAKPFANSTLLNRRRSQQQSQRGASALPEMDGVMNSVFVGTRKGKSLIIHREGEVEAVCVHLNTTKPSKETNYVSYTQRLLQDEPNDGVSSESIAIQTESEGEETNGVEDRTSHGTAAAPLFMNANGEISNLESFDEIGESDRYSIRHFKTRATSDPVMLSRFSTCSTANEVVQDVNPHGDLMRHSSSSTGAPSTVPRATSLKRGNRFEDLMRPTSISNRTTSTTRPATNADESVAHNDNKGTRRRPGVSGDKSSLSLNRDRTNTSVASMFSQDSTHYGSFKARYPSFVSEPSNVPIAQEFKDMVDEIKQNPGTMMNWLNPL